MTNYVCMYVLAYKARESVVQNFPQATRTERNMQKYFNRLLPVISVNYKSAPLNVILFYVHTDFLISITACLFTPPILQVISLSFKMKAYGCRIHTTNVRSLIHKVAKTE